MLFKNKKRDASGFEQELFTALTPTEHEVTRAAENPFLLRRLMVGIAAEQRKQKEVAATWSLSFGVALRATPALAGIALLSLFLFWFSDRMSPRDLRIKAKVSRVEATPVAASELPMMSNEDLMSIMMGGRPTEPRRGQ